jgi:hypothetical protein
MPNSTGTFALGLTDGDQTVVTVLPVDDLPTDHWRMVRAGGAFTFTTRAMPPFIVVQVAGGAAAVFVDDIELHAPHDRVEFWAAEYRPTPAVPTPSPTPIPTATPTPPPSGFIEVLSAAEAGARSASVEVVEIDGRPVTPYLAPVTPVGSLLKAVLGTAFISSTSRAGLERSPNNPGSIRFRVPFDLPQSFSKPKLIFQASFEGTARLFLNDNNSPFWTIDRKPGDTPIEIQETKRERFRPGPNQLQIELINETPKATIALSFRLVVTYEQP